jgi:RNA recognition motif-containing protein
MDQMAPPMPPLPNMHQMNGYAAPGLHQSSRGSPPMDSDELIPTAIVIKNIPFAVKKEQLVAIMTEMSLPLPYAFNYHFDNGVFRGLAFANFTTPEETQQVIDMMNHLELQGRKLRVEYKKMLPAAERDRIERDKRERRGQLQEQHQPMNQGQLHNQASVTSLNSNIPATSPSPISQRSENKLSEYPPSPIKNILTV